MLQVRRAHRRETEPPLYRVVLSRRLLRPSNRIIHDCCQYGCSRRWQRPGRPDLD
ncbi:hypothetical protein DPMN_156967 [Dreissena polymorpha]|uniref:Uncharacterized protein n=1 Tax=Dreissena polymorpha TaxID=45954 RepID=A0A9D4FV69_DREPO|nr:hypothetical protein DPMN_156967 [Dreissena polymorpha]